MAFDPIDSLNTQILNAIGATVPDATEKQNAADAVEAFLNANPGFVKEVLNDDLRDTIKNNHSGFAIVKVDLSTNEVTVSDLSHNKVKKGQDTIKRKARRDFITTTYIANMDTGNMTQEQIDTQTDALNTL